MPTEADTCRTLVLPKLYAAGWTDEQIAEQCTFTAGRIVVQGTKATRRKGKRADYLLRYTRDKVLAVIEAKVEYKKPADGLQQAIDYAQILGLKFAYSTNGHGIIEFDLITGKETELDGFPTPAALWSRLRAGENLKDDAQAERILTPLNLTTGKIPMNSPRAWTGGANAKKTTAPGSSPSRNCSPSAATSIARTRPPRKTSPICRPPNSPTS